MGKYLLSFLLIIFSLSNYAVAQNVIVGVITDEDGATMPLVNIVVLTDKVNSNIIGTTSSQFGDYRLEVGNLKTVTVRYSSIGFKPVDKVFTFYDKKVQRANVILYEDINVISGAVISGKKDPKYGAVTRIDPKLADKIPLGGIEKLAVLTSMGVRANNELSSQYTVRGGNYDENLVYVNDFEVYRQFLVRSGQQEGLSFINPDMVASVDFSSGGFEAKYGDKLSSVLDVKYKQPRKFAGSVSGSLLGFTTHLEGKSKNDRFTYLLGFRQKSNKYLLNALPTQGQYQPLFLDFQSFLTYRVSPNWQLQYISNFSRNQFKFFPQYEERNFGDVTNALRLSIFFEGGENDRYTSFMNGLGANFSSENGKLNLKFQSSLYQSSETEAFDIIGQYFIGEVESNLGDNTFGDVVRSYGIGTYHNWARNRLTAQMLNFVHKGNLDKGKHYISWGLRIQNEQIEDKIDEWQRIDSAGYSMPYPINDVPYTGEEVNLFKILKSKNDLKSNRYSGYIQDSWTFGKTENLNITAGTRFNYWNVNKEFFITPRVQFYLKPNRKYKGDPTDEVSIKNGKISRIVQMCPIGFQLVLIINHHFIESCVIGMV